MSNSSFQIYLDNIIFSLQRAGGISTYWFQLIKRLAKENRIYLFQNSSKNLSSFEELLSTDKEINLWSSILRYLPFTKKIVPYAIFHSSYYRVSLQKNIINITTVHDFTYEYYRKGIGCWIHHNQKMFAIKKSDGVICVSENTKKDLLKLYKNKAEKKYIKVIYNGVNDDFKRVKKFKERLAIIFPELIEKEYILYVGSRSSYKNFNIAISVLEKEKKYFVLIGGGELSKQEQGLINNIKERVFHLKWIDNEKLNILYNNAFCLLYPSSYEGFGIPILEAMRAGCPVISTNCSSIPEVAGDAALLVDKIEVDEFIKKMKILEDCQVRSSLIEKGFRQAEKFSWDKCAQETYSFYEEVYKKKFG